MWFFRTTIAIFLVLTLSCTAANEDDDQGLSIHDQNHFDLFEYNGERELMMKKKRKPKPKACVGSGTYQVNFIGKWSAARHPLNYPFGLAAFSPIGVVVHSSKISVAAPKASAPIETVAESGDLGPLVTFLLNANASTGLIYDIQAGAGCTVAGGVCNQTVTVKVNPENTVLTLITRLSPSPDFFTGAFDLNLCNTRTGQWTPYLLAETFAFDAGTDAGANFTSPDAPQTPAKTISQISCGANFCENKKSNTCTKRGNKFFPLAVAAWEFILNTA